MTKIIQLQPAPWSMSAVLRTEDGSDYIEPVLFVGVRDDGTLTYLIRDMEKGLAPATTADGFQEFRFTLSPRPPGFAGVPEIADEEGVSLSQ